MTKCFPRLSTCCSTGKSPRVSLVFCQGFWLSLFYEMPGNPAYTETLYLKLALIPRRLPPLLNNDLLLLRVHTALRSLSRNRNHGFPGRQRRREVMETAI